MKYSSLRTVFLSILFAAFVLVVSGCGGKNVNVQASLNRPIEETGSFHKGKKYIKHGMTVVYLTGTPYEIGFAHGKLCKNEIMDAHQYCWDAYDKLKNTPDGKWLPLSRSLEKYIPEEYIAEMKGIADGSQIDYKKILFLNTISTISEGRGCFVFSYQDKDSKIITYRQGDLPTETFLYKKMLLYIIKPDRGHGFAALLNPGWVDGESGINEQGVTVAQNNISIEQTEWEVMPITLLSRYILQYSKTIEEAEQLLNKQKRFPVRLLSISTPNSAAVFEIANSDKARIDMEYGYLVAANHARKIPSQPVSGSSYSRLEYANQFLKKNSANMDISTGLELIRSNKISRRWQWGVHNRLSYIFSPSTLDFWIAIAPDSNYLPASYGPFVGFNLMHELYGSGEKPNPSSFPAY